MGKQANFVDCIGASGKEKKIIIRKLARIKI